MEKLAYRKIEEITDEFWENEINDTNKELIEDFLTQQHLAEQTIKQYTSALRIFAWWVHTSVNPKGDAIIPDLRPRDARKYQDWLLMKGLSPSGVKFKRSAVSTFCGFIELYYDREYPNFRNIYSKAIPNVAKTTKEKIPLTSVELNKIISVLEKKEDWQKIAYIWFTFSTGSRREESRQLLAEVANYNPVEKEDEDGVVKRFYVTHTIRAKGRGREGKPRKFKFDERAMNAIKKWLEYRKEQLPDDDCPYVFASKKKDGYKQLSANTFNLWCKEFSKIIGKKVHPHLFRSSRATIAILEEGKDIKSVQTLLGHESSQTTEIYIVRDDSDVDDDLF